MAVMNGFRKELLDKILGLNGHVVVQPLESPDRLEGGRRAISKVDGICLRPRWLTGRRWHPPFVGCVRARHPCAGSERRHVDCQEHQAGHPRRIRRGAALRSAAALQDQLSLRAGDSITLVAPRGAVTPMGTTPRIKPYKVAAVFEIGMSEYDASFVFMPLAEAQAYFNRANDVTAIEVYTVNPDKIDVYRKSVTEAAQRPIFLVDWRQRNSTFFNALQVERNVMFLILTSLFWWRRSTSSPA
jgi:lipoprotein-releasing system permease protein